MNNLAGSLLNLKLFKEATVEARRAVEAARERLAENQNSERSRDVLAFCLDTLGATLLETCHLSTV